ncbi:hypothetical protein [Streptomyces sp. AK04-3B]|uniref:hypothetical protein n=1 Tax=Streptomyces sp. AK04-3B TaxID=3028650 RepID=UPI0029A01E42|nr:hypothetical protein [Streptomyces sp. AK04-3B]MDX3799319.1 hypothetical protein [Streptomyces sp. AK04-3B]
MAERAVGRRTIRAAVASLAALGAVAGPAGAHPRPGATLSVGVSWPSRPSDFAPVTETVRGRVGDTVVVRLGVTNLGPGVADDGGPGSFAVVPPPGTTITSIPHEGDDDDRRYSCLPPQDADNHFFLCDFSAVPGSSATLRFHIRIDRQIPGAEGSVTVYGPNDPVVGNDRAVFRVEAAPAPLWRWQNPLWQWQRWALAAGALAVLAPVGRRLVARRRHPTPRWLPRRPPKNRAGPGQGRG